MLFRFRKNHRQWKLKYTFVYQNHEVHEYDRFLTREEAEERFRTMYAYHAQLGQPITRAQLAGPHGFHQDLTPISELSQTQPLRRLEPA